MELSILSFKMRPILAYFLKKPSSLKILQRWKSSQRYKFEQKPELKAKKAEAKDYFLLVNRHFSVDNVEISEDFPFFRLFLQQLLPWESGKPRGYSGKMIWLPILGKKALPKP